MNKLLIKNTSMLYLMSIAKLAFPLITLPYLTRVLSVDCYGAVAYVKNVMQYMQLFVDFGFMLSGTKDIVKAREDNKQLELVTIEILWARVVLSVFAFIIVVILSLSIPILRSNFVFSVLSFMPVFLTCFLFDYLFRGIEKMEIITIRFVVMRGIACILTFILVKNDHSILWIPALDIIGTLVAIILVLREIKKMKIRLFFPNVKKIIGKIQESAIYFLSNMATTAFTAFNTILIGILLEPKDIAFWSLCNQLIGAVQALYTPITDSIYPQMIGTKDKKLIRKTLLFFMPIIIVGCIITVTFSKYILLIIGGTKYIDATYLLRLLTPILFISFPTMLYGWPTLGSINKQREVTLTTVIAAVIQVLGLIILAISNSFSLVNIALLRCATETFMCVSRLLLVKHYREQFN